MKPIYSRRNFLKACGLATAALYSDALRSATIKVASPEVEYVLRGGQTYIDGRWCSCDIGITPRGRLVVSKPPKGLSSHSKNTNWATVSQQPCKCTAEQHMQAIITVISAGKNTTSTGVFPLK